MALINTLTGQTDQTLTITIVKDRALYEQLWFWGVVIFLALALVLGVAMIFFRRKTRALERKATSIVLVHNHPSGNPRPGPGDYEATELLRKACSAIGLTLLDHIVASDNAFFSFNEERLTVNTV